MESTGKAAVAEFVATFALIFIGAGAVVRSDVPAYALMVGVPARRVGWMCQCGIRLQLRDGRAGCSACGARYRETEGRLTQIDPPGANG